jgi:hypothetical protein
MPRPIFGIDLEGAGPSAPGMGGKPMFSLHGCKGLQPSRSTTAIKDFTSAGCLGSDSLGHLSVAVAWPFTR